MTFTPGMDLEYAVDPDGFLEVVFTDWTQDNTPEGEEAA